MGVKFHNETCVGKRTFISIHIPLIYMMCTCLTLMLVVANLADTKMMQKTTNMTGFSVFQKIFASSLPGGGGGGGHLGI